jgi:hypothetical protein
MDRKEVLERLARGEISRDEAERLMPGEGSVVVSEMPGRQGPGRAARPDRRARRSAAAWLILHGVLLLGIAIALVTAVPRFMAMFEDLGVELPVVTRMVLALSGTMQRCWYVIVPAGALLFVMHAFVCLFLASLPRGRALPLYSVAVSAAILALAGLAVVALFLPVPGLADG